MQIDTDASKKRRKSRERANAAPARTRKPSAARKRPTDAAVARQAQQHSRIRKDHAQETAEDYVELISQLIRGQGEARTVQIAQRLGVSHVTVTKTIARLQREGLVRSEPYRSIFLTESGQTLAHTTESRHQLVVQFLCRIGVSPSEAEIDAEGIEHHVSQATLDAMRRFLERGS